MEFRRIVGAEAEASAQVNEAIARRNKKGDTSTRRAGVGGGGAVGVAERAI